MGFFRRSLPLALLLFSQTSHAESVEIRAISAGVTLSGTPLGVAITQPEENAVLRSTVTVAATATSEVGVSQVAFAVDGTTVATDLSAPYQFIWDPRTVALGSHTLSATVFEVTGSSATASIHVTRAP